MTGNGERIRRKFDRLAEVNLRHSPRCPGFSVGDGAAWRLGGRPDLFVTAAASGLARSHQGLASGATSVFVGMTEPAGGRGHASTGFSTSVFTATGPPPPPRRCRAGDCAGPSGADGGTIGSAVSRRSNCDRDDRPQSGCHGAGIVSCDHGADCVVVSRKRISLASRPAIHADQTAGGRGFQIKAGARRLVGPPSRTPSELSRTGPTWPRFRAPENIGRTLPSRGPT